MLNLLTSLAATFCPQGPSTAPVVINEFCYDDTGTDDREFVELYNRSGAPVDISGWVVFADDPTTTNPAYTIPPGTILPAGGYWVLGSAVVPNVDQVVGTSNLWENDNESLELHDAASVVIDSVAYETARGSWGPHPREGNGILAEMVTVDANPQTFQRRRDGYDSDDNGCDFCVMAWTPGAANGSAQTVLPRTRFAFDAAAGTSLTNDFNWSFVAANVQAPGAIANSTSSTLAIPASPQGGNVAVFNDPTGGGNANWLRVASSEQFLLEAWVWVVGGNAAFAAPGATTGEGEAWAIGVTGMTDGAAHPPDINGYHGQIQCTALRPGATGIGWFAYVQQAQTTIVLADLNNGGAGINVLGTVVATPGVNDGWQRLRLRIDGGNLVGNFGGTFGCDDGQRFTATGVGNCGGTVYFQYRECIVSNALMTPLILDDVEVYGITNASVTFGGAGSPTTVGTPSIGTAGGPPQVGNTGFQITGAGLLPNNVQLLVLGLGNLNPGLPIPGAPPGAQLYVNTIASSLLLFSNGGGTTSFSLGIPCVNAFVDSRVTAQLMDLDLALPFATPIGTSPGMRMVVGN